LFGDGRSRVVGAGDESRADRHEAPADAGSRKLAVIGGAQAQTARRPQRCATRERVHYPVMEGRMVFKHAVESMTGS
jgi:3-oxoacyl-[acyl-carrier-protein] synthase III